MRVLILCYSLSCLSASSVTPAGLENWVDVDSFLGELYANKLEPVYFLSWVITTREILEAFLQSTSLDNFQRTMPRRRPSGSSTVSTSGTSSGTSPSTPRVGIRPPLNEIKRAVTAHKNWLDKRVEECLTSVAETSEFLNPEIFECIYAQSPPPSAGQSPSLTAAESGSPDVSPMMLPAVTSVVSAWTLSSSMMDRVKLGSPSVTNEVFDSTVDPIGPVIDLESDS